MRPRSAFGDPDRICQEVPGQIEDAITGTGGFLAVLGDADVPAPWLAQVLTVQRPLHGNLRVCVEVPITPDNCGQPVTARALHKTVRSKAGEARQSQGESDTHGLPGCDAVHEFVALHTLFAPPSAASD